APQREGGEQGGTEGSSPLGTPYEYGRDPRGGETGRHGQAGHAERGHQVRRYQAVVGGVHPAVPEQAVRRTPVPRHEPGPRLLRREITAAGGEEGPPEGVEGKREERRDERNTMTPAEVAKGARPPGGRVRALDQGEFGR